MTARHIMDSRSRHSRRYRDTHYALAKEVYGPKLPWWLKDLFS